MITELAANILSCAIEGPTSYFVGRKMKWPCRGPLHMAMASCAATGITHPQMWVYVHPLVLQYGFWGMFFILEALVVLAEGVLIAWMADLRLDRAMLASLIANSTSAFLGLFLAPLFK
jgi:hypothetical protein